MSDFDPTDIPLETMEASPVVEYRFDEDGTCYAVARLVEEVAKVVYVDPDDNTTPIPEVVPVRDADAGDFEAAENSTPV